MKQINSIALHKPKNKLEVFLFNVGQGDHIMLKFPSNAYGLIDFYYDKKLNMVEPPALSYFKDLKNKLSSDEFSKITISFFCVSHNDLDHTKGIVETIKWFHDNGVVIKEIWLGAANDESQLRNYLNIKIPAIINKMTINEKIKYHFNISEFDNNIQDFFIYVNKWKKKKFKNNRYKTEPFGKVEYLAEIRSLRKPCDKCNCQITNLGPFRSQLDQYYNNLTLEIALKILGINTTSDYIDKNDISHIFQIKFEGYKLIFGGDAHKDIWEECIATYNDPNQSFLEMYGGIESNFIKISHHGSKNSSSPFIWKNIISKEGIVYLGISAGRHEGHKHPNSETLKEIRENSNNVNILSTNLCTQCLLNNTFESEHHVWLNDFLINQKNYKKETPNNFDKEIHQTLDRIRPKIEFSSNKEMSFNLLAYVFEFPIENGEEIIVKVALTNSIINNTCFYSKHEEKLFQNCNII